MKKPPGDSPPARSSRLASAAGSGIALAGVALVAAALRAAHLVAFTPSPLSRVLSLDHAQYDGWARQILGGETLVRPYFVDPLYAYFLAGVYRLFGHDLLTVRVIQAGLGVATVVLVALIARRVLESRALANLAALLFAVFLPAIHSEAAIEKTALATFLFAAALAVFVSGPWRGPAGRRAGLIWLAGAGALVGLGALARGNLLLFLPLGALLLFAAAERRVDRLARAGVFIAAGLVALAPATIHNLRHGAFALTTVNAGQNLYIGNSAANLHGTYHPPAFVRPDPRFEEADFAAEAARRVGRELGPAELSAYWREQAVGEISRAPGTAFVRVLEKLRLGVHQYEVPDNDNVALAAWFSPVLRLPLLWMGALFPLAALGMVALWRRPGARLLTLVVAAHLAGLAAFFVVARFRTLLGVPLTVLAAGGIGWAFARGRAGGLRATAAPAALVLVLGVLTHAEPAWIRAQRRAGLAISWNNLASGLLERGERDAAIACWERAVAVDEKNVLAALRSLAALRIEDGNVEAAAALLGRIVRHKPGDAAGARLVSLVESRSRELFAEDRPAYATWILSLALVHGPYDEGRAYRVGELMAEHVSPQEMVDFWTEQAARDEKPQTSHYFRGRGLAALGDSAGAASAFAHALEIDPAHESSVNVWGELLESQGRLAEALAKYELAVEIHPEFKGAHENAARVLDALGRPEEAAAARARAAASDPKTPRRFVYWARHLARAGRRDAAVAELRRALAARADDAEAAALLDDLAGPGASLGARLDAANLRGASVWLVVAADPGAAALANELAAGFAAAGWTLRDRRLASFRPRRGILLFAAEETPPPAFNALAAALEAGGLPPAVVASGYRTYSEEARLTRPGWQGVTFLPGQEYVVVVGPQ